jgi:hypothetical protein
VGQELVVIEKRPAHRPAFPWTEEVEEYLILGLICGQTLTEICEQEAMPSYYVVYNRRQTDADFDNKIMRARREGAHAMADQCKIIADTPLMGRTVTYGPDGMTMKVEDAKAHRHMQIETRLRLMGKINSDYSDKAAPPGPTTINATITNVTVEHTPQEAAEIYTEKLRVVR